MSFGVTLPGIQKHKFLLAGSLFVVFLLYFIFANAWYEPARLVIKGRAVNPDAFVTVQWDSGWGYNGYEQEKFQFVPTRSGPGKQHRVILAGGAEKNVSSKNSRIILTEIRIDDRGYPIPPVTLQAVRYVRGTGWVFDSDDAKIVLTLPIKKQLYFSLKTNNRSGIALITVDGQQTRHDLYRSNWEVLLNKVNFWFLDEQGNFAVSSDMPRYTVDSLRITVPEKTAVTSVSLKTKSGRIINLSLPEDQHNGQYRISAPLSSLKHYFHPDRIIFQIIFALFATWITCLLLHTISRYGGTKDFFTGKKLRLFWVMFSGALIVYSGWLSAFWPGVMSVDSLNIWRAAWLPDVMINNHPVVNVIWYMFLQHVWNNIAVVPLSQILLLSLLTAGTFFFCFRQGVRLRWLLPCYLLLLGSLPVGLYNITLWKDVPFALLVVFWSLVPAYFLYRKRSGQPLQLSLSQIMLLLFLFVALVLFRHNGIVYLFFLPVLFFLLQLVKVPKIFLAAGVVAVAGLFVLVVFPPASIKGGSYFHDLSRMYLQQLEQESPGTRIFDAAREYPRLLDLKKNKAQSDLWHYYLGDRYAYTFLRQSGWNDTHTYLPPNHYPVPALHDAALKLYEKSMEYPWVYLSWNPFWLLYLFPLSMLLYSRFPLSAVFSSVILVQVVSLLIFVGTTNWRYYYFVLLGGYFLLPIMLLDRHVFRLQKPQKVSS